MWHILYLSYESEGRDYIGAHSTEDINDGYLGSYRDRSFSPDHRIIIGYYKTRNSLLRAEENLQKSLDVARDPQYANRSIQTSTGFNRQGVKDSPETVERKRQASEGEKNGFFGKTHTKQTREEWSKKRKGRVESAETKRKKSEAHTGSTKSIETKQKIAVGRTGKQHSATSRLKMSEQRMGSSNPAYGRKWWVNRHNETLYQQTSPGSEWQQGRKWKQQ